MQSISMLSKGSMRDRMSGELSCEECRREISRGNVHGEIWAFPTTFLSGMHIRPTVIFYIITIYKLAVIYELEACEIRYSID